MMADLNCANNSLHWIQQSTCEHGSCFFTLRRSANLLKKVVHSRSIPPVASLHLSDSLSIFLFRCSFMGSLLHHKLLVLIRGGTRVKNECQRRPPASTPKTCSPEIKPCLIFTVGGPELKVFPIKGLQSLQLSHTSLWRKLGRPPLWQDMAWSMSKVVPHIGNVPPIS